MTYRFASRRYSVAFRTPVRTAHTLWSERTGIFVRLENEKRAVGFGEASPIPWFGTETTEQVEAVCRGWGEWVTEEQIAAVPASLGCLRCALEAARHDVDGPAGALPTGTVEAERGEAYRSVAALLPAGRAALAKIDAFSETGFRTFKWKVGVSDIADELSLMDDLLGRMPAGAKLRLDANGAWDRRRAERWFDRCADRPVEFVEQPIAHDLKGAEDLLLGLGNDYPTPIALDESVALSGQIERWLGLGWHGVFVVKPQLLSNWEAVQARLVKAKASVVFSSALETAIGARHALRVAFEFPGERRALGFGVWPLFRDDRFDGPAAAPFIRRKDVDAIQPEAVWNALS